MSKRMAKSSSRPVLTTNGYLAKNRNGEDNQIAGARWEFIQALQRVLPAFFTQLRERVYPEYARQTEGKPGYWHVGWRFDTWRLRSDRENVVAPRLLEWARAHNVDDEQWILEGALQTLSFWHQTPDCRESLDVHGFRSSVVVPILLGDPGTFKFENWGWDPQFWSAESWRASVTQCFEEAVNSHIDQMRRLIESRGAVPAVSQFRVEHFEWLALFQCGGWSLEAIRGQATHIGDKTTISKGIHKAARLMGMKVRPKNRKLKSS